jgi:hypothetical protein
MVEKDGISFCVIFKVPKELQSENQMEPSNDEFKNHPRVTVLVDPGRINLIYGVEITKDETKTRIDITKGE